MTHSTTELYRRVISDVMERISDDFISAGVDDQVLHDLRQLWEQKLLASGALQHEIDALLGTTTSTASAPSMPPVPMASAAQPSSSIAVSPQPKPSATNATAPAPSSTTTTIATATASAATRPGEVTPGDELLGSDLDDSDEEAEAAVDQESANQLLCQYDKVHRSKNKWKCQFKDGMLQVNGRDYVLHKAQGDFEF